MQFPENNCTLTTVVVSAHQFKIFSSVSPDHILRNYCILQVYNITLLSISEDKINRFHFLEPYRGSRRSYTHIKRYTHEWLQLGLGSMNGHQSTWSTILFTFEPSHPSPMHLYYNNVALELHKHVIQRTDLNHPILYMHIGNKGIQDIWFISLVLVSVYK